MGKSFYIIERADINGLPVIITKNKSIIITFYTTLEVIKLKDIISAMEAAIDGFEVVANTVEQIVVKES